jgi:hypothetical protein
MEAEISLLMANQTLVSIASLLSLPHPWMMMRRTTQASPGKLIYDPFIGTGSMAYVWCRQLLIIAIDTYEIS